MGNGLAHFARVSSFPFPIPDLDVTHNRLMHDQENNWFLCQIASERDRVKVGTLPQLLTYSYSYCLTKYAQ